MTDGAFNENEQVKFIIAIRRLLNSPRRRFWEEQANPTSNSCFLKLTVGRPRVGAPSTAVPIMPARQTIVIVSVVSLLLLYLFVHHTTSSHKPSVPNVPSRGAGEAAYRQRLVAVGDLHGGAFDLLVAPEQLLDRVFQLSFLIVSDIDNAKKTLQMAQIIDDDSKWVASTDILVQTGDIVDRGAYADDIYRLMQSLRGQAASQGGKVVSILGNHEVMNAIGDWR